MVTKQLEDILYRSIKCGLVHDQLSFHCCRPRFVNALSNPKLGNVPGIMYAILGKLKTRQAPQKPSNKQNNEIQCGVLVAQW